MLRENTPVAAMQKRQGLSPEECRIRPGCFLI